MTVWRWSCFSPVHQAANRGHQLIVFASRSAGRRRARSGVRDRRAGERDLVERAGPRGSASDVDAVALLVDHSLDPSDLAGDACRRDQLVLVASSAQRWDTHGYRTDCGRRLARLRDTLLMAWRCGRRLRFRDLGSGAGVGAARADRASLGAAGGGGPARHGLGALIVVSYAAVAIAKSLFQKELAASASPSNSRRRTSFGAGLVLWTLIAGSSRLPSTSAPRDDRLDGALSARVRTRGSSRRARARAGATATRAPQRCGGCACGASTRGPTSRTTSAATGMLYKEIAVGFLLGLRRSDPRATLRDAFLTSSPHAVQVLWAR